MSGELRAVTVHTRGQISGADTEDTINAIEAARRAGDTDALFGNG